MIFKLSTFKNESLVIFTHKKEENMSVLIVGADRIKAMVPKMEAMGIEHVTHWDTRRYKSSKNKIPAHIDLVVFFTDFLHHTVALKLKEKVKNLGLPTIYCRRAWSEMQPELQKQLEKDS
jgi:hypothetical protein